MPIKRVEISSAEKNKVIALLGDGAMTNPLNNIAQVLNVHFGWPVSTGRIRARAIIDILANDKTIELENNGKRLKSIKLKGVVEEKQVVLVPCLVKPQVASPLKPKVQTVVSRRRYQPQKKGVARDRRQRELVGDRAENRLYNISLKLADVLKNKFSDVIKEVSISRSGHHNPKKGKIDLQDSAGEDVTILMTLRDEGRYRKERMIYDSKNSRESAAKFNSHIRFYPGQTGALLKKAIVTGKVRSDREMASEILQDMVSVQLLPPHCAEDALSSFGEI